MTRIMVPHAGYASQFAKLPNGMIIHGACSIMAITAALTSVLGLSTAPQDMQSLLVDIYEFMHSAGKCGDNGAADFGEIQWGIVNYAAHAYKKRIPIVAAQPFIGAALTVNEWRPDFLNYAGRYPIVCQFLNGQALQNVSHDGGDERGLECHANTCLGRSEEGYPFCDGDNTDCIEGKDFAVYDRDTIIRAHICSFLVVGYPVGIQPPNNHVPAGWEYDATDQVLTAPNGIKVPPLFTNYILSHSDWWTGNMPLNQQEEGKDHMQQWFAQCLLGWNQHDGVFLSTAGLAYEALHKQYLELSTHALNVNSLNGVKESLTTALDIVTELQKGATTQS